MEYSNFIDTLIAQGHYTAAAVSVFLWIFFIVAAIVIEILVIKYFIRYGINYYFKKLTEHEMKYQIDDIGYDVMTHKEDE